MDVMRLRWRGQAVELCTGRAGLRTTATLLVDSGPLAEGRGIGRVLLRLPATDRPAAAVLVLAPLPGVVVRAVLLEPRAPEEQTADDQPAGGLVDLATALRHPFDPAPGSVAGRLLVFQERHPRLWAARHVALGVAKVLGSLLGVVVLLQALVRPLLRWLSGLLPAIDLPDLPLPDVDIAWPDLDLPEFSLPAWMAAVLATAKFWGPVLVGVVLAVRETRRRRSPSGDRPDRAPGDDATDAHPRP